MLEITVSTIFFDKKNSYLNILYNYRDVIVIIFNWAVTFKFSLI